VGNRSGGSSPTGGGGGQGSGSAGAVAPISYQDVRLSQGNARYEYRPAQEYITIYYSAGRDAAPLNISGWRLVNLRGTSVTIPSGAGLFQAGAANQALTPILLSPGGEAVITSGKVPERNPYPINTSFRLNRCSGYLEDLPHYNFTPRLSSDCPDPGEEPEVVNLPNQCYDFVRSLAACHDPEFERRSDGRYVDDRPDELTLQCRQFVEERFNYQTCVERYRNTPEFYEDEWRVFLGSSWELWAERREHIQLYDQFGRLVDEITYD
jgi:hypothetical protein